MGGFQCFLGIETLPYFRNFDYPFVWGSHGEINLNVVLVSIVEVRESRTLRQIHTRQASFPMFVKSLVHLWFVRLDMCPRSTLSSVEGKMPCP